MSEHASPVFDPKSVKCPFFSAGQLQDLRCRGKECAVYSHAFNRCSFQLMAEALANDLLLTAKLDH